MTDVEKYGLFALLFVVSILGLAWLLGPDEAIPETSPVSRSVVLERPGGATAATASTRSRQPPRRRAAAVPVAAGTRRQALATPAGTGRVQAVHYTVAPLVDTTAKFHFDDPPVPYPGERSASLAAPRAGFVQHTVAKNETLSDVSKRYYGTSRKWREILKANPGLDETKLQVGQVIDVPAAATLGRLGGNGGPQGVYVVRQGDTLGAIAQRELGSVKRTSDLFAANRDVISSPDDLKVGMHLRIP